MKLTVENSVESSTTKIAQSDALDTSHGSDQPLYEWDNGGFRLAQAGWTIFTACIKFESKCSKLLDFTAKKWREMLGIRSKATWIRAAPANLMNSDTLTENSLTATEMEATKIVKDQNFSIDRLPKLSICTANDERQPVSAKTLNISDFDIPSSFGIANDTSIDKQDMHEAHQPLNPDDLSFEGMLSKLSFSFDDDLDGVEAKEQQRRSMNFGQEFAGLLKDLSQLEESVHDADEASQPAGLWIAQTHEETFSQRELPVNSDISQSEEAEGSLKGFNIQSQVNQSQRLPSQLGSSQINVPQIISSQLSLEQKLIFSAEPRFISNELIDADEDLEDLDIDLSGANESDMDAEVEDTGKKKLKSTPMKLSKSKFDVQVRLHAQYEEPKATLTEVLLRSQRDQRGRKSKTQHSIVFPLRLLRIFSWKEPSIIEVFLKNEQLRHEDSHPKTPKPSHLPQNVAPNVELDFSQHPDLEILSLPDQNIDKQSQLLSSGRINESLFSSTPRRTISEHEDESYPSIDDVIRAEQTIMQDTSLFPCRILSSAAGTGQNKPESVDLGLLSVELTMDDISTSIPKDSGSSHFEERIEYSRSVFESALLKYMKECHTNSDLELDQCFAKLPRPPSINHWQIADFVEALLHMAGKTITLYQDLANSSSSPIMIRLLHQ